MLAQKAGPDGPVFCIFRKILKTTGVTAYDMLTKEPERMKFR